MASRWSAHSSTCIDITSSRDVKPKNVFRCFLAGTLGAVLVLAAAGVIVAAYGDYRGREAVTAAMAQLDSYRIAIAENAIKTGRLEGSGTGVVVPAEEQSRLGLDYVRIFLDGTIVMRHGKYHQVIVWEPTIENGEIGWKCVGGPRNDVPPWCR